MDRKGFGGSGSTFGGGYGRRKEKKERELRGKVKGVRNGEGENFSALDAVA